MDNLEEKNWKLYIHTNKVNGKKYIGITSQEPERRWRSGYGYRGQPFFNAIEKYGWDGFEHEIIATGLTVEQAENMEINLIRIYHSLIGENGYNLCTGGLACTVSNSVPVYQFDLHGSFVHEYGSILEAEKMCNIYSQNIIACCMGKTNHAGEYIWRYKEDVENVTDFKNTLNLDAFDRYEPVYQFDIGQNYIAKYENAFSASKENPACTSNCILEVCRGKYDTCGGYIWRFVTDVQDVNDFKNQAIDFKKKPRRYSTVYQFDKNGVFIKKYPNYVAAGEELHCNPSDIRVCCNGGNKTSNGYIWRYKEDYERNPNVLVKKKTRARAVLQYDYNGVYLREYESLIEAAKQTGCSHSDISNTCSGKLDSAHNFIWRYKDDFDEIPDRIDVSKLKCRKKPV